MDIHIRRVNLVVLTRVVSKKLVEALDFERPDKLSLLRGFGVDDVIYYGMLSEEAGVELKFMNTSKTLLGKNCDGRLFHIHQQRPAKKCRKKSVLDNMLFEN